MYTYRSLQPSDLDTLCRFPQNEEELFYMFPGAAFPLTPKQLQDAADQRMEPTVILFHQEVVAYANFYGYDGSSCWLGNVIVSPDYRGIGASNYLIQTMETVARQQLHVNKVKIVCHNTNTKGLLFYKKHGYQPTDISSYVKPSGEQIARIHLEKKL